MYCTVRVLIVISIERVGACRVLKSVYIAASPQMLSWMFAVRFISRRAIFTVDTQLCQLTHTHYKKEKTFSAMRCSKANSAKEGKSSYSLPVFQFTDVRENVTKRTNVAKRLSRRRGSRNARASRSLPRFAAYEIGLRTTYRTWRDSRGYLLRAIFGPAKFPRYSEKRTECRTEIDLCAQGKPSRKL